MPGLPAGLGRSPRPALLRRDECLLKLAGDTQTLDASTWRPTSLFLDRHDLSAHVDTLRAAYARKKGVIDLDAMRRHFPQDVRVTDPRRRAVPLWWNSPRASTPTAFMRDVATAATRAWPMLPGEDLLSRHRAGQHCAFNYSAQSDARIEEGIKALGAALKTHA